MRRQTARLKRIVMACRSPGGTWNCHVVWIASMVRKPLSSSVIKGEQTAYLGRLYLGRNLVILVSHARDTSQKSRLSSVQVGPVVNATRAESGTRRGETGGVSKLGNVHFSHHQRSPAAGQESAPAHAPMWYLRKRVVRSDAMELISSRVWVLVYTSSWSIGRHVTFSR